MMGQRGQGCRQPLGAKKKEEGMGFSLESPGGTSPANALIKSRESDFRFLTCRTERE